MVVASEVVRTRRKPTCRGGSRERRTQWLGDSDPHCHTKRQCRYNNPESVGYPRWFIHAYSSRRSVKWPQMVKRYIRYIAAFTGQMIHAFEGSANLIKRNHLRSEPLGLARDHRDSRGRCVTIKT